MAEYYFHFPPITSLTLPQQAALNEPNPIALSGGPGTGKSFVSLWRHISNHKRETPIRSQLLTFTTSLAYYLRINSASQNNIAGEYVDSTQEWYYNNPQTRDEIIVDEAQDMPLHFYENQNNFRRLTNKVSYGADDKQILKAGAKNSDGTFNLDICSPEKELNRVFKNKIFALDRNFRNTKSILRFANSAFSEAYIRQDEINSCIYEGDKPIMYISNNIQSQNKTIIDIVSQFNADQHNIGILTPLANIPYMGGETLTARYYYNLLKNRFDCSFYDYTEHNGSGLNAMKNIHITPFKSSKGLEFDTVIIPCFDSYLKTFRVVTWRDFFVAVTRAKSNLFVFTESEIPYLNNVVEKIYLNNFINSNEFSSPNNEEDELPF